MCTASGEGSNSRILNTTASLDTEGHYQCVSCNELGNVVINFTIVVLS